MLSIDKFFDRLDKHNTFAGVIVFTGIVILITLGIALLLGVAFAILIAWKPWAPAAVVLSVVSLGFALSVRNVLTGKWWR